MSTSGGAGTKFCVYCHSLVEKAKHRCQFCNSALCRQHRGKLSKNDGGFFGSSSVYQCYPPCEGKLQEAGVVVQRGEVVHGGEVQTGDVSSRRDQWERQHSSESSGGGGGAMSDYSNRGGSTSPNPAGKRGGSSAGTPVTFSMTSLAEQLSQKPNSQTPVGRVTRRGGGEEQQATPTTGVSSNSSFTTPTARTAPNGSPVTPVAGGGTTGVWVPFPQASAIDPGTNKRTVTMPANGGGDSSGSPQNPSPNLVTLEVECTLQLYQRHNISSTGLCEMPTNDKGDMIRGICLGALPSGSLVWHQRGAAYPSIIPMEHVPFVTSFKCAKCRHCGVAMPFDESAAHVAIHKQSGAGTVVDDVVGIACGDVQLLLSLMRKRKLGEGAQGVVWLCERAPAQNLTSQLHSPPGGSSSAGRFVSKDIICATKEEAQKRYQQSVRFMKLQHEHLIQYTAAQLRPDKTTVVVVMPYYADKDLSYLIRNATRFEEDYIGSIVLQIAGACRYIHGHSPPIIHGDIKSDNILMFNQKSQVLLMDLDTSVELVGGKQQAMEASGTTEWASPETLHDGLSLPASDIWSLGLLIYVLAVLPDFPMIRTEPSETGVRGDEVLLNNREVWGSKTSSSGGKNKNDLAITVQNTMMAKGFSSELSRLTAAMLNHDPTKRPTAAKVIDFLTDLMTKQLLAKAGVE